MKIDKIIFSTSEKFSVFWNMNSKLWKTKVGIEPLCLLFGKKSNTDMNEDYGKVIEVPIMEQWPLLIQITWSKFYWPTMEPDTTWMTGDIDMFPLNKAWWTTNIADVPDDWYVHLDADGITQLNGTEFTWANKEINRHNQQDRGHDTNLPAQYHCAKGYMFKKALNINDSFENEIRHIVNSGMYNGTRGFREEDTIEQHNLWCAEELRSTRAIRENCHNRRIQFKGYFLASGLRPNGDHIHKDLYDNYENVYTHVDYEKLKNGGYKNLHMIRPFKENWDQTICDKRWAASMNLFKIAGMLD